MSGARKLQTEIDRTLKKVEEGVEIFDEIWDKVGRALAVGIPNPSPVERSFHMDSIFCCLTARAHLTQNYPGGLRGDPAEPKGEV
mmetsp:Transcript_7013/g.16042  ORF Transcript_7013/g.16042 Transcript_7013/m.16042 type:complete len:85 (+) Transcript_7013:133-387(+)